MFRTAILTAFVVSAVSAPVLPAQTVTLPSIRTTGLDPETRRLARLLRFVEVAHRARPDSTQADSLRTLRLDNALTRLATAGLSERALETLDTASRRGPGVTSATPYRREGDELRLRVLSRLARGDPAGRRLLLSGDTLPVRGYDDLDEKETGGLLQEFVDFEPSGELRDSLQTLQQVARLVVVRRKLRTRAFFPVRAHEQAREFWRQQGFSTLNIASFTSGGERGAAFTEFASPILHAVRLSLSGVLATGGSGTSTSGSGSGASGGPTTTRGESQKGDKSPASEDALTRFVNGGGLVNAAGAWPVWHYVTRTASEPNGAFAGTLLLTQRVGATLPRVDGAPRDSSTLMSDSGLEIHLRSTDFGVGAGGGVGAFAQLRLAYAAGSDRFGDQLGIANQADDFGYVSVTYGLFFAGRYLVTAGRIVAGPPTLRGLGWQIGLTAVRQGTSATP